jgi:hypothetical protein
LKSKTACRVARVSHIVLFAQEVLDEVEVVTYDQHGIPDMALIGQNLNLLLIGQSLTLKIIILL